MRLRLAALLAMAAMPAFAQGTPPVGDVVYVCPGGQDFTARFAADGELATLMVPGQPDLELTRQVSGSGFAFGDSYFELRGRGREVTLAQRGGGSMRCHAAGQPGQPARSFADASGALTVTLLPDGLFRLRERRPNEPPRTDHGLWSEEVDGGLRLVLRGAASGRRSFRQGAAGELLAIDPPGSVDLAPLPAVDPIDEPFRLSGMFRVAPEGGVFSECTTGRLFRPLASDAELALERAWTERAPARETTLHATILARFAGDGRLAVEEFVGLRPGESCPAPPTPGAALRGTEWRVVEIDGQPLVVESGRRQPRLVLDETGRYSGTTGCNTMSGGYTLDAAGLRFAATAVTKMDCGEEARVVEARFLAALALVRQAKLAGTTLDLFDPAMPGATPTGLRRLRLEARGR